MKDWLVKQTPPQNPCKTCAPQEMAVQAAHLLHMNGVDRSPLSALNALQAQVADLRERIFELGDLARRGVPHELSEVHVSLQTAANELGDAERTLRDAGRIPAGA
jgi:hypothetical protein